MSSDFLNINNQLKEIESDIEYECILTKGEIEKKGVSCTGATSMTQLYEKAKLIEQPPTLKAGSTLTILDTPLLNHYRLSTTGSTILQFQTNFNGSFTFYMKYLDNMSTSKSKAYQLTVVRESKTVFSSNIAGTGSEQKTKTITVTGVKYRDVLYLKGYGDSTSTGIHIYNIKLTGDYVI